MRYLLFFTILSICLPATADMYKWTDEDGKIIYSDKRNPNGSEEKVTGAPLTTYDPDAVIKKPAVAPSNAKQNEAQTTSYSKFTIEQPVNDEAFRQNAGNVTVKFAMTPALNYAIGHKIEVFLDGNKSGETNNQTYNIASVNPGTHTLSAKLLNRNGTVLKSHSVTFHLLRVSVR